MLLVVMPTAAQSLTESAKSFVFYYDSYDGQKNKVKLSCKVYYENKAKPIKHILLSCHPTTTSNETVPTGPRPLDSGVSRMCGADDDSYIMISPDYCGYGISSHHQHPYLIHDVTARNCLDALLPAIQASIDNGLTFRNNGENMNGKAYVDALLQGRIPKFSLEIVGYSQGGATALACAKLLDGDACPDELQKGFVLHHTCCGDGPYSIFHTMKQYMEWGKPTRPDGGLDLEYPCVLPLIVAAAKEAYNDGCMRTVEVEDYFNPEFLATGILDDLKTKNVGTNALNTKAEQAMPRRRPVDILSRKIITEEGEFNTETKEYKCLMRAMELADLCTGWEPKHSITFYHIPADKVVPYVNYSEGIMGQNGIGTLYRNTGLIRYISPQYGMNDCPHAAVAAMTDSDIDLVPDWDKVRHDNGGKYFFLAFIFSPHVRSLD